MPNYKLTIQYDGTDFNGWQSQPDGNTIQDKITSAIEQISQQIVNLTGSGRTDSGVHAFGQAANFKIPEPLNIYKFRHSLNSILPNTIAIKDIVEVSENFNSRFDAKSRSYLYLIGKSKSPFYYRYSYQYPNIKNLDVLLLKKLSNILLGEKDFTSFCKTQTDTENKICNITEITWRDTKDFLILKIEANRFLHGMVRTIVGTLLYGASHNKDIEFIKDILNKQNREAAKESAPAKGLFLLKVKY